MRNSVQAMFIAWRSDSTGVRNIGGDGERHAVRAWNIDDRRQPRFARKE
jgi:hypothetical protein